MLGSISLPSPSCQLSGNGARAARTRAARIVVCRAASGGDQGDGRRQVLLGLAAAALSTALQPGLASAAEAPEPVYFGNGCFWGRQKDFVDTELALGRTPDKVSALVGYAGGTTAGPDNRVCYFYSDPRTVYERLGHAEVVNLELSSSDPSKAREEFKRFATTYFKQFKKTNRGMSRSDPQDEGPGYRNVVGLPGGVDSPFFEILKEANVYGMELKAGQGNAPGQVREDDVFNTVWVVDSRQLPFYRAENYHQFHHGLGKKFPTSYTVELKQQVAAAGRLAPTGCLEWPF